ncbi:MAG: redoxin domain-containing protein [Acidobacteriota bacterium]|nr:redoxin domain-containing protein [Acidobacteriota bacterium]
MRKVIVLILAVVLVAAFYELGHRRSGSPKPASSQGNPAPEFSLAGLDGRPLSLADYRGKVVLLDFWATWCVPCRAEIPHFVEFQNKYREQGLQVVGISMDDGLKPVQEFYQQYKMNYPVALGTDKVAESYGGVLGLPVTFLIGRDGRIAAKYIGAAHMPVIEQKIQTLLQAN